MWKLQYFLIPLLLNCSILHLSPWVHTGDLGCSRCSPRTSLQVRVLCLHHFCENPHRQLIGPWLICIAVILWRACFCDMIGQKCFSLNSICSRVLVGMRTCGRRQLPFRRCKLTMPSQTQSTSSTQHMSMKPCLTVRSESQRRKTNGAPELTAQ